MNRHSLLLPLLLAAATSAQTQLVRGDVDGIQGTNRFQLECTQIELVSNTVNLQQLHNISQQQDIEFEMQVSVLSTNPTVLNVVSAMQIPELFDMGNLRIGRADSWEVRGTPGARTAVFLTARSLTGYFPVGAAGTWVLGFNTVLVNQGTIGPFGQFQFQFQPPNIPSLIGAEFTGQAVVQTNTLPGFMITNPDCKELETR